MKGPRSAIWSGSESTFHVMNEFTPRGYISVREAINRVGLRLFPSDWTGQEHQARRGLLSEEEWLKTKDVAPARGSGATGSGSMHRETIAKPVSAARRSLDRDPSDPLYQAEYRASKRYTAACEHLREMLEAGDLEGAIWDRWTGTLHRAGVALWRRHDAARLIAKGSAPLPRSADMGSLIVKDFDDSKPNIPISAARLADVVKALREKTAAKRLTRAEQKDFIRQTFSSYQITERQFSQIFRQVPVPTGRPKNSDKEV